MIASVGMLHIAAIAQQHEPAPSYTVKNGVIYCDEGIPETPRWFADSRLAFSFDEAGVAQVDYYSPVSHQNLPTFFLRQLWDGFRYYIEKNNQTYKPEFTNCKILPFGITADWKFNNYVFKQSVLAVDESIIFQVTAPDTLVDSLNFKLEFYEAFGLTRGSDDDLRFINNAFNRKWEPWVFNNSLHVLEGKCVSIPKQSSGTFHSFETNIIIGSNCNAAHILRPINTKHILKSPVMQAGKTYSFVVSFGNDKQALQQKQRHLIDSLSFYVAHQFERYKKVADNSPHLTSPYTDLNNFISLAPMYHESLKVLDVPGAIRAKTTNYWVWGWDGMTSNYATCYWGDTAHLKDLLWFYKNTADPKEGIGHAFEYDMQPSSISALPAQGMYTSLLQLYFANTADAQTVKDLYPFARLIFNRIAAQEVAVTGMSKGTSLFPDFPVMMEETGQDISGFNTTIFYTAARSMEWLAAFTGDVAQQQKAKTIIDKIEKNFLPLFFDQQNNFIVSSIDAITLKQRNVHNSNSIRWENNYCYDLIRNIDSASLIFLKQNAVTPMGLREIPVSSSAYDMDANQLHCGWPANGEYFVRLINRMNQKDLMNQYIQWVSYWTQHLTCPEGISNYIETSAPEFDRWTSQKGTWQGYSMRAWYQAALHGVVGVGADVGGITFYPYSGEEMKLEGFNYLGKKIDIEMRGSGPYISSIVVDGITIKGTAKVPADLYRDKQHVSIVVNRTLVNELPFAVVTGNAIQLQNYKWEEDKINATLSGCGLCRLQLSAKKKPVIKLSGKKVNAIYDASTQMATVEMEMQPNAFYSLEVR